MNDITATVWTDDNKHKVLFNCNEWFALAKDEEIKELAESNFEYSEMSDKVAEFYEDKIPEIKKLFEHTGSYNYIGLNRKDMIGFECSIEEAEAWDWIKINKPLLFAELSPDYNFNMEDIYIVTPIEFDGTNSDDVIFLDTNKDGDNSLFKTALDLAINNEFECVDEYDNPNSWIHVFTTDENNLITGIKKEADSEMLRLASEEILKICGYEFIHYKQVDISDISNKAIERIDNASKNISKDTKLER